MGYADILYYLPKDEDYRAWIGPNVSVPILLGIGFKVTHLHQCWPGIVFGGSMPNSVRLNFNSTSGRVMSNLSVHQCQMAGLPLLFC